MCQENCFTHDYAQNSNPICETRNCVEYTANTNENRH